MAGNWNMRNTKFRHGGRAASKPQMPQMLKPVLLIEDQRTLAQMAEVMLRAECGCEVMIAASLREAGQLLEAHGSEFIVAICDLNLPDGSDGEVIDLVKKYNVPIIALTGAFGEELRNMIIDKGVVDYVLKEGKNSYEYVVHLVSRLHKNASIKVLVADDSLSVRTALRHMLCLQGLDVLLARDGYEALELIKEYPEIKLVLVDYHMPKIDGYSFVLEARNRIGKDRLAIIGMSGEGGAGHVSAQFLKNGANDFITKPYSYEELICRVTQNLEMLELVESVQNIANRDYLTGLYNRRFFFDEGSSTYNDAKKNGTSLLVAMLDIDNFKKVNDDYGHDNGDMVLKDVATQLRAYFPDNLVARFGGEEFAILIAGDDLQSIRGRLEAFRQHVEHNVLHCGQQNIAFTVSIGCCHELLDNLDMMLKMADQNLYRAKHSGRNIIVM